MSRAPHRPAHPAPPARPVPSAPVAENSREAKLAYLASERGLRARRRELGTYEYSYLPTAFGNVGYTLTAADFTTDELVEYANIMQGDLYNARAIGDTKGVADATAAIAICVAELTTRGVAWSPAPDHDRAPLTVPEVPHAGGR